MADIQSEFDACTYLCLYFRLYTTRMFKIYIRWYSYQWMFLHLQQRNIQPSSHLRNATSSFTWAGQNSDRCHQNKDINMKEKNQYLGLHGLHVGANWTPRRVNGAYFEHNPLETQDRDTQYKRDNVLLFTNSSPDHRRMSLHWKWASECQMSLYIFVSGRLCKLRRWGERERDREDSRFTNTVHSVCLISVASRFRYAV